VADFLGLDKKELFIEGKPEGRDAFFYRFLLQNGKKEEIDLHACGSRKCIRELSLSKTCLIDRDYDLLTRGTDLETFTAQTGFFWKAPGEECFRLKHTEVENLLLLALAEQELDFPLEEKVMENLEELIRGTAIRMAKTMRLQPCLNQLRREPYQLEECRFVSRLENLDAIRVEEAVEESRRQLEEAIGGDFGNAMVLLAGKVIWIWLQSCGTVPRPNERFRRQIEEKVGSQIALTPFTQTIADDLARIVE